MRMKIIVGLIVFMVLAAWSPACAEFGFTGGACAVDDDCHTYYNFYGGTICQLDRCTCPNPVESPCCPDGTSKCEWSEFACRARSICEAGSIVETSGATGSSSSSSSGSGGPVVEVIFGGPCTTVDECPFPMDKRCGPKECVDGRCKFDIDLGEPTASQYPGDCSALTCDKSGDVKKVLVGAADLPYDGNPCHQAYCTGDVPTQLVLVNNAPCAGEESGICVFGKCQECSEALGLGECKPGEFCNEDRCSPLSCKDGLLNDNETDKDCGGPDCLPCDAGSKCNQHSDCISAHCASGVCQKGTHSDMIKNDDESGVDCGYPGGMLHMCKDGEACLSRNECMSDVCYFGVCQPPTCTDGTMNGDETDVDCGGVVCLPCH